MKKIPAKKKRSGDVLSIDTYSLMGDPGASGNWIRRRLRAYVWKQWKLPRTRVRNLMAHGIARTWAVMVGNTRKGAWRLSKNGTVCAALPDDWFTRSAGTILLGSFCQ